MKLPSITVKCDFDDIQQIIDEVKCLQTYKLFEGDDMILIDRAELVDILIKHLRTESKYD